MQSCVAAFGRVEQRCGGGSCSSGVNRAGVWWGEMWGRVWWGAESLLCPEPHWCSINGCHCLWVHGAATVGEVMLKSDAGRSWCQGIPAHSILGLSGPLSPNCPPNCLGTWAPRAPRSPAPSLCVRLWGVGLVCFHGDGHNRDVLLSLAQPTS